jgi:PST family polysaccharide transporter
VTGSASLLTVVLGIASTKVIAVVAGPAAIALMGLYRTLGALVNRSLLLGLDTTLVQRISTARDRRTVDETIGSALLAIALQAGVVLLLAAFFAGLLGRWVLGAPPSHAQLWEVRATLAMAFVNLVLQLMTAALSGRVEVRKVAQVGVVASVATLALIYPLLRLGNIGLALNVGSGSTVGAALATVYVWRLYGSGYSRPTLSRCWEVLRASSARSIFLIIHPIVMMSGMLTLQSLVERGHAMEGLGSYNAMTTILDTSVMVLMTSARTFFFPALGQMESHEDKAWFVNRVLRLNLILSGVATIGLIATAPISIPILFSGRFEQAPALLAAGSIALVGQGFIWSYSTFFLHHARYGLFFALDVVWVTLLVGGTAIAVAFGVSLETLAWIYAGSYTVSGLTYALIATLLYGKGLLDSGNMKLGIIAIATAIAGSLLHRRAAWPVNATFALICISGGAWLLARFAREMRGRTA